MSKNKNIILISLMFNLILSCFIIYFIFFRLDEDDIFNKTKGSIVELKCVSLFGESYSTAICYSENKLITNAHCVTYQYFNQDTIFDQYFMRIHGDSEYLEINLETYSLEEDLAILTFDDDEIKPIPIISSINIGYGDKVFAVGNAFNYGLSITCGNISIPLLKVSYDNKSRLVIQCDLVINEGNSGGALIDSQGRMIGMTTFRLKDDMGNVNYGISYCIPSDIILSYIQNYDEYES